MTERDQTLIGLLACCEAAQQARVPWWQVARAVERAGSARTLLSGPWEPADRWEYEVAAALARHLTPDALERWRDALLSWLQEGYLTYVTILDADYPAGLRAIFNPPPFLFVRGALLRRDVRGVAVVGTRRPSEEGRQHARRLARELASESVTVYSGLAAGIDAEAHRGALEAGGRSIGVLGHGIQRPVYPRENRQLAEQLLSSGALVSQFRADTPPTRATFPMRNTVTSGLSQATAVVEATHTSGARMQARIAAEQGKRVWLLRSLVDRFAWARQFADRYAACVRVIADVGEVVAELRSEDEVFRDLPAGLPPVHDAEVERRPEPAPEPLFVLD
jgi:DNA processing protein